MEIPFKYHVSVQEKAVAWVSKKVNLIIKEHKCVVNRCLDEKKNQKQWNNEFLIIWSKYFFVGFIEVNSGRNSRAGPGKSVPLRRCPL